MNETTKEIALFTQGNDTSPPQGGSMTPNADTTIGDLVAAAFDEAAHYATDLRKVSQLATQAVTRLLRRARSRSLVTDAIQGVISDGRRFPAYGTPVPVGAQIRVAVYAASVVAFPAQVDPSLRSEAFGCSHGMRRT